MPDNGIVGNKRKGIFQNIFSRHFRFKSAIFKIVQIGHTKERKYLKIRQSRDQGDRMSWQKIAQNAAQHIF
jgi:hypothetical protein